MITHRDAEIRDAAALAAFARQSFSDTFAHLYPPDDLAVFLAESYGADNQAREMQDARYRIAEQDDALIGYAMVGAFKLPFDAGARNARELYRLYVAEAAKGRGVADALMNWAIDSACADGADDLYLGVYFENPRAIAFYTRHGFAKVGEYEFPVGRVRDREFIMRRALR